MARSNAVRVTQGESNFVWAVEFVDLKAWSGRSMTIFMGPNAEKKANELAEKLAN